MAWEQVIASNGMVIDAIRSTTPLDWNSIPRSSRPDDTTRAVQYYVVTSGRTLTLARARCYSLAIVQLDEATRR